MLSAVLLSFIVAASAVESFHARFPDAHRIVSLDGERLVHASGFALATPYKVPEEAARAFLSLHGPAFGVTDRQLLVTESAPSGEAGVVRFLRTIDGLPVFNGGLNVGVDAQGRVFAVNGSDVPPSISGRRALDDASAVRSALAGFPGAVGGAGPMRVAAGWRRAGSSLRPVYRVDFIARSPAGDWRVFVDAETGATLFREDLRKYVDREGRAYDVSPSETAPALCPLVGAAHPPCTTPLTKTFTNLTTGADLTGTQTTAFNCKGGNAPTANTLTTACGSPVAAAADGTFDFPEDPTFKSTTGDDFSAAMAYFHLDKHISLFKRLDPTLPPPGNGNALRAPVPAFVNVLVGGRPFENAFFSPNLDAMVFGQGASADFAYDAGVAYHEFTHGVISAWGDFIIDIDGLGGLDEPGAVNEGTADTMASAETGRPELGAFVTSVDPTNPAPFIRNMSDPNATRTCQGNGDETNPLVGGTINGLDGEVHDDGEIWNGLNWEVFQGLKAAGFKGCNGACEAEPALQYKAIQLAGGTEPTLQSQWLTLKAAASALFPANPDVASYIDCVGRRRGFDKCDRTVPIYQNEIKSEFIRLRFSTFQVVANATGPGSQFGVCSFKVTPSTVYARKGQPVQLTGIDPNTGQAAAITADQTFTFTQDCATVGLKVFSLPSAGTWYFLIESPNAIPGGNPGFDVYGIGVAPTGFTTRPPKTAPAICDTPSTLAIAAPSTTVPPRGHLALAASGGSGSGFAWSIAKNLSGGSIDAATGVYTAGANPNVTDLVEVNDTAGNIRTRQISVGAGVTVSPPTTTLPRQGKVTFTATGGSGTGFTWALAANASGATINASNGQYKAGGTPNVTDLVRATDSFGNTADAIVTVNNAPPADDGGHGCTTGGDANALALLAGAMALLRGRRRRSR